MTAALSIDTFLPQLVLMPDVDAQAEAERIGLALRRARKAHWGDRGSLAKAASIAGVSQALLSMIERGHHAISKVRAENLTRFPEAYGLSVQAFSDLTGIVLVTPRGETENVSVQTPRSPTEYLPLLRLSTAHRDDAEPEQDTYPIRAAQRRPGTRLYLLDTTEMQQGDEGLRAGTTLYVDTHDTRPEPGLVYVIATAEGGHLRQYVERRGRGSWVASNNAEFEDVPASEARVVGLLYDAYGPISFPRKLS